MSDLLHFCKHY